MGAYTIKKIGVIGSGTMGSGIAQIAAMADFEVLLFDMNAEALERAKVRIEKNLDGAIKRGKIDEAKKEATLGKLTFTEEFKDLKADLFIEAIIEDVKTKRKLFNKLDKQNDDKTIFATNTSSISIGKIAAKLDNPHRLVGMHFFNPAHIMKLVEVISGPSTSKEVEDCIYDLSLQLGKQPVRVKDSPGFIVNRVARHYYLESLRIVEQNVADVEAVDELMEYSGFRMGPFRLMDLIGIDVNLQVTKTLHEAFYYHPRFRPKRSQQQKVDAGHLGRKTGKGFYNYESES